MHLKSLMDIFYSEGILQEQQGKEFRNGVGWGGFSQPGFMVKLGVEDKFNWLRREKVECVMFTTTWKDTVVKNRSKTKRGSINF